jgi:hypothetical protein
VKRWCTLIAVLLVGAVLVTVWTKHTQRAEQRYGQITAGMTIAEVTATLGFEPELGDASKGGRTLRWFFRGIQSSEQVVVEFDHNLRVVGKGLYRHVSERPYTTTLDYQTFDERRARQEVTRNPQ